jgi:hypothetical protein
VQHGDLGRGVLEIERDERVAVERREEEVADADVELDRLDVGVALRRRRLLLLFDEERADEAPAKIREREALGLEIAFRLARADDEIDERLIGAPPIDRQRRDARADDDREREETLTDDLAERLEAPDSFADSFEPAVGAERVERELSLGCSQGLRRVSREVAICHVVLRQCTHTGFTPQPSQRSGSRRDGQRWSIPMWQREKS